MPGMAGRGTWKRRSHGSKGPEPIASVLLRASSGASRDGAPLPPKAWHDAVGDRIARRARPMRLENGVLTVRAATAVWAQELTFLAPSIVQRLKALGIQVESLRFRVGPIDAVDRPLQPPAVKTVPARRPLPATLDREIARVGDEKLRSAIAGAAAANLAWQDGRSRPSVAKRIGARLGPATTSAPRAAPGPRSAGGETDPQGRTPTTARGAGRHKS
jgi:hypothetical protein